MVTSFCASLQEREAVQASSRTDSLVSSLTFSSVPDASFAMSLRVDMASRTSGSPSPLVPQTLSRTILDMKQKFKSLFRALLGLLGIIKHEQFTHSDIHGNLYYFDGNTSEYTISSIQACASGRITAVSEMFSNTDNLEIRIAPAKSKRNTVQRSDLNSLLIQMTKS